LDKAISAHGGKKNLGNPRKGILKGKGVKEDFTSEEIFDLPNQWKRTNATLIDGKKSVGFVVMRDGRAWEWQQGDDRAREMKDKGEVGPYIGIVTALLELCEENTKLSVLEETKVLGGPAVRLRTKRNGKRRDYYFDKRTDLMVQVDFRWQPVPGKEFDTRTEFRNYKEVDGLQLPHRQTTYIKLDGSEDYELLSDYLITEVNILEKLPEGAFDMPGHADAERQLKKLQGTWFHLSREVDAKEIVGEDKDIVLTVAGENWRLAYEGKEMQSGTLKIIDARGPQGKFDLIVNKGPDKGTTVLCLYQMEDDVLKYCGNVKTRPTSLQTKPGDRSYCSTFKKDRGK